MISSKYKNTNLYNITKNISNNYLDFKTVNDKIRRLNYRKYGRYTMEPYFQEIYPNKINKLLIKPDDNMNNNKIRESESIGNIDKGILNPSLYMGVVLDGDWDKNTKSFENDEMYRSFRNHIFHGDPLSETPYIKSCKRLGKEEEEKLKIRSLIKKIRRYGFKSRYELGQLEKGELPCQKKKQWPVTVNIDRNGNYIFNNTGKKRLYIAKLLDIDEIPVTTVIFHKKYTNGQ